MVTYIFYSIIACLLLYILKYFNDYKYLFFYSWQIPGPKQIPFLGYGYEMSGQKNLYDMMLRLCPKFSPIFKIWNFSTLFVVITEPKNCRKVFSTCISRSEENDMLIPGIGKGLFILRDQEWKQRRKLLNKSFRQSILNNYFRIFEKYSQKFISILGENVEKEVKIDSLIKFNGFELIIESCVGLEQLDQELKQEMQNLFFKLEKLILQRLSRPIIHNAYFWRLTSNYRQTNYLSNRLRNMLELTFDQYDDKKNQEPNFFSCLLDLLNDGKLSKSDVIDELQNILPAGTDSTNVTISTALVILGIRHDIHNKVRQEIFKIIGSKDGEITADYLNQMIYLQCFIKETLRLFSTGAVLIRQAAENIPLDNFVIPSGAQIILPTEFLHRDPKFWEDPLTFRPERFFPEVFDKEENNSYLPFGYAPRNCLGVKFAMTVVQLYICEILRNFQIVKSQYSSISEMEMKFSAVLRDLKHGYKITVKRL